MGRELTVEEMMDVNLLRWNEKAHANQTSRFYDLEGFLKKKDNLMPIEIEELGDISGKDLLHLQCHFGMDSLSLAHRGANVTGVDFSPEAIAIAEKLSAKVKVPARFVLSNIYDLDTTLPETFDIVYTSYGVLCWLPDVREWGRIIANHLRPGGSFHIVENHPFGETIDDNCSVRFQSSIPYFQRSPSMYDDDHTVDEGHTFKNKTRFEWSHPLSEIVNSLVSQGLRLEFLHEFPFSFFPIHPDMEMREDGYWYFRSDRIDVPMLFSMKMSKR